MPRVRDKNRDHRGDAERLRDALLADVRGGRLTPREAEAEAKRLGLSPLNPEPNVADYDPMDEVWWTLVMVVAWIAWRSIAEVTRVWDVYRSGASYWQRRTWRVGFDGRVRRGFILKESDPAKLSILALREIHQKTHNTLPADAISVEAARQALWKELGENRIQATGINTETRKREVIPDHEWRDLVHVNEQGRDVVRYREGHGVSGRGYDELAFRSQTIADIWQPEPD